MLVLFLVFYITRSGSSEATSVPSFERRDSASCDNLKYCRTTWNIVWSCLITIFACTWAAVHRNIPRVIYKPGIGPVHRWLWNPLSSAISYRLPLFVIALLAPEYILAWAIRQYIVAGQIMEIMKKSQGWTRAHGFFVIMGGFHLFPCPDGQHDRFSSHEADPIRPLDIYDLRSGEFDFAVPTEEEIKDRSKSDSLAKAVVLVQTLWFVVQCIARGIKDLPLTELEVVTLAYATMNFGIYLFWWHKPHDVGYPIRVFSKSTAMRGEKAGSTKGKSWMDYMGDIFNYIAGAQDRDVQLSDKDEVPMFWSATSVQSDGSRSTRTVWIANLISSMVGLVFGGIHFIAWSSEFPSHTELMLWRISCCGMIAFFVFSSAFIAATLTEIFLHTSDLVTAVIVGLLTLALLLYTFSRIVTIVLAFISLRSLPYAAYQIVDWTDFIPHI